jgi:predicted AAA+ superfamily ATPase
MPPRDTPARPALGGLAERAYIPRVIDEELDVFLAGLGAVALDGAKGVGKSVTAARRAARSYRLDDPAVAELVRGDIDAALAPPHPVLFDEWQHVPAIWDAVRRRIDDDATPGIALFTGSATLSGDGLPRHTGAGRIVGRRMRPLALSERLIADRVNLGTTTLVSVRALLEPGPRPWLAGTIEWRLRDYTREIVASGFPAIRPLPSALRVAMVDAYIEQLVTRDAREAGGTPPDPMAIRRTLLAFAAATGTTSSLEKLRTIAGAGDGTPMAKTTLLRHRDVLERLFILEPIPGWAPAGSPLARLGVAPKHHLVDPALAVHLLGLDERALLVGESTPVADAVVRDGPLLGTLFESLVMQSLRTYAQAAGVALHHCRTHRGDHEIDALLVRRDQRVVALEVKLSPTVDDRDVRHLHWLREALGDRLLDALVITPGPGAYRRDDGIGVVPAALLGP